MPRKTLLRSEVRLREVATNEFRIVLQLDETAHVKWSTSMMGFDERGDSYTYWGHYFDTEAEALMDYVRRCAYYGLDPRLACRHFMTCDHFRTCDKADCLNCAQVRDFVRAAKGVPI